MESPIDRCNRSIKKARLNLAGKGNNHLTRAMLKQLRCISWHNGAVILVPTKPYFYKSMYKRLGPITKALKEVDDSIITVGLISGGGK